jgi:RNA polymerase sigma-70 factor (ECF subfamily)
MKDPDPKLLERCQQKDPEAFAQLVAEQQDYVYTLARRVLHNPEDAAELTQDVFLHVWKGLPFFRRESRFRTWLYRIVVNHCLNRLRRVRRESRTLQLDEHISRQLADTSNDPYVAAWKEERREYIWSQVEQLPERYRLVLTLFYQQEMSCAEIATLLGIPVGTVKTHLYRARAALADTLPQGGQDAL